MMKSATFMKLRRRSGESKHGHKRQKKGESDHQLMGRQSNDFFFILL